MTVITRRFLWAWAILTVLATIAYLFWTFGECRSVDPSMYSRFIQITSVCDGGMNRGWYTSQGFWIGVVAAPVLGVPILTLIVGWLTVQRPLVVWAIHLVDGRVGTGLQRGLARFWLAASAGWLVHAVWWACSRCSVSSSGGYLCASGTFRIERATLSGSDVWSYILMTPMALLAVTFAIYWIARGFIVAPPSSD
jgi:hypothetical protein